MARDCFTVSVIITAYNSEQYLHDAINSVVKQSYDDFEIIIVDDGSDTDACELIVREITNNTNVPIRYIYQINRGPSAARNRGVAESRGEFISFLDSDDMYEPNKLSMQVGIFKELSGEYAFISGGARLYYEANGRIKNNIPKPLNGNIYLVLVQNSINGLGLNGTPGHLFRRSAIQEVGGYDESLRNNEDFDLLIRLAEKYKVLTHQDIVCSVQKRIGSLSNKNPEESLRNSLKFIDKLSKRDSTLPQSLIEQKKQRAYFAAAKDYMVRGNFENYAKIMKQGVRCHGLPRTWRSSLALLVSYSGLIGKLVFRILCFLKRKKQKSFNKRAKEFLN